MGGTCRVIGNAYTILAGKAEGKRSLCGLTCSWEDDIKMNLEETGSELDSWEPMADCCEQGNWINLRIP